MARSKLRKLKRRIAGSAVLNKTAAWIFAGYIRLCYRTARWHREGFDETDAVLKCGQPIINIIWHERLPMCPYLFDISRYPLSAVTTHSRVATLGQVALGHFGIEAVTFDPKESPVGATRAVIRKMRDGYSVALSPDGSRGPTREAKAFPIPWIRATKAPVFCVAYSIRRGFRLPTWDRALIPLPFSRGALMVKRWDYEMSAKPDEAEIERLRQSLNRAANDITDAADRAAGRPLDMSFRSSNQDNAMR
ncbi:MAG: DUF374 domain-containing protein [Pseudomonadota bacterium]